MCRSPVDLLPPEKKTILFLNFRCNILSVKFYILFAFLTTAGQPNGGNLRVIRVSLVDLRLLCFFINNFSMLNRTDVIIIKYMLWTLVDLLFL